MGARVVDTSWDFFTPSLFSPTPGPELPWNQGVVQGGPVHMRQKKSKCLRANAKEIRAGCQGGNLCAPPNGVCFFPQHQPASGSAPSQPSIKTIPARVLSRFT